MSTQPITLLGVQEYLELERAAEFRSEYLNGEVHAMAGGGRNHALIAMAVGATLHSQLRGRPCAVAGSDLRVFCRPANVFTYPDVTVFCEPSTYLDSQRDTLTDATVIVEVSRNNFHLHRGLPSFSEYLLLAQDSMRAEHYVRQQDGSWNFREWNGADVEIELKSIDCALNLGSLYERVEFAPD